MMANGYTEEFALRVFKQLEGFGSYGFPESHAVSFALLVYVSSWLKYYYPDVFATAILNSMPMGFYQPAQLISDARKHDVVVKQVCQSNLRAAGYRQGDASQDQDSRDQQPCRYMFREQHNTAPRGDDRHGKLNCCSACCGESPQGRIPAHISQTRGQRAR